MRQRVHARGFGPRRQRDLLEHTKDGEDAEGRREVWNTRVRHTDAVDGDASSGNNSESQAPVMVVVAQDVAMGRSTSG